MKLDLAFVRSQFPQLDDNPELVFCSNAGGSYMARQTLDLMEHYNRHLRVQPYNAFTPAREAGQAMDLARSSWAQALNIEDSELTVGPSTSINTYVMAQSLGASWGPGDEIVVSQQDHEANHGVWRRQAEARGALVREWAIDPDTGLLDPDDLYPLLNDNTRAVCFTHCSNIVGTVNPVADITAGIRQRCSAIICVDAVAYAPHHICDLKALGVDLYFFSLYKVFGPHQGIMYVSSNVQESAQPQSHFFTHSDSVCQFNPAGPQHAQVAACQGSIDYLQALHQHHYGSSDQSLSQKMHSLYELMAEHETSLAEPLLDYLHNAPHVRLIGKPHCKDADRAATIAFKPLQQSSAEVTTALQALGIGTENGNFYAYRAVSNLGIDQQDGLVRLSLLHYSSGDEVDRILAALDQVLS